jgi:hypothetical protein
MEIITITTARMNESPSSSQGPGNESNNQNETPPLQTTNAIISRGSRRVSRAVLQRVEEHQADTNFSGQNFHHPTTTITTTTNDNSLSEFDNLVSTLNSVDESEANGGDSDVEGEDAEVFDESLVRSMVDRSENEDGGFLVSNISSGSIGFVLSKDTGLVPAEGILDNANTIPKVPDSWVPPEKKDPNQPDFDKVDNPGNWNEYIYRPVYSKKGTGANATYEYIRHELPTGCSPVPLNPSSQRRERNGWQFHYNGWQSTREKKARSGADPGNLFPEERESSLDKDCLVRLGLTEKRMKECDALFFCSYYYQFVIHYAGQKGFGLLMTTRRDRLPKDIRPEHLHKRKTDSSLRTKIARYVEPVVAVKKGFFYDIVHTSFQSTSSCNIMSVNSVSENKNFVEARTRGRKDKKRVYVIEQNYTRLLYLNSYSRIDSMDHLVKNCNLFYTCWKYWHSPVNHAKALAIVTAYDMYLECCEGKLDSSWKIDRPESFHTFREKLSLQQLQYDPKQQLYPGDDKMRVVTQLNKKRRRSFVTGEGINQNICSLAASDDSGLVTYEQYREVKKRKKRFCDLPAYGSHLASIVSHKHSAKCAVCSLKAYKRCTKCGVSLHNNDSKGAGKGKQCFLQWHSESYLGICFADRSLVNLTSNEWKQPSNTKVTQNKKLIKKYQDRINSL